MINSIFCVFCSTKELNCYIIKRWALSSFQHISYFLHKFFSVHSFFDHCRALSTDAQFNTLAAIVTAHATSLEHECRRRRRRRRRLKGIHSRPDTNRTGAEDLSFYYPRLLHCLDQMLAVMSLS